MPWVRFDDQYPIHRKVEGLSDAAFRLHAEAIFWCARNLTDGFVPSKDLSVVATARRPHKSLPELVARGLWIEHTDGWQVHDYLDYQPSKAKVDRERDAKAERQARWRHNRVDVSTRDASTRDASTSRRTSKNTKKSRNVDASHRYVDASQDASVTPAPPRPETSGAGGRPERRPAASAPPRGAGRGSSNGSRASPQDTPNARAPDVIHACHFCDGDGWRYERGRRIVATPYLRCDHTPPTADTFTTPEPSTAEMTEAGRRAERRRHAIDACGLCDQDGYRDGWVCDHDPDAADRATRGLATARAALDQRKDTTA